MVFASETDIAYMPTGHLVEKDGNPGDGAYVKKGWTGENEWIEFINPLPLFINPPKGFFSMANNRFISENNKLLATNANPSSRGRRINNLIEE